MPFIFNISQIKIKRKKIYFNIFLLLFQEIQANKTYTLLISVEDDGVVSSMSSGQIVYNKITIKFNCTVISTSKGYYTWCYLYSKRIHLV